MAVDVKPPDYEAKYFGLLHVLKQIADWMRDVALCHAVPSGLKRKAKALADLVDEEIRNR